MLLLPSTYWGAVIASITVAIVRIPKLGDRVQSLEPNFIKWYTDAYFITEIAYASGMLDRGLLLGYLGNYQKRILLIIYPFLCKDGG